MPGLSRIDMLNRRIAVNSSSPPLSGPRRAGAADASGTGAQAKKKPMSTPRSKSPKKVPPSHSLSPLDDSRVSVSMSDYVKAARQTIVEETQLIEKLRREAAISLSLEIDLKAEKRVNDELKKEVHEVRLQNVSLETRTRTLRQEEEMMSRRLGELRDQKKQLEEERERRAFDTKCQIDTLEEQLREERQRCKGREREHAQERDELFRGLQAATSTKADETDRIKRSLVDAEVRCESVLQELNNLRQQVQLQRSREQEMADALRAARRDLAEEESRNRSGQEELMKRVKDQEVDSNKQKADKTVECVKIECLEETLNKLRSELKSALQAREGLAEECEALLDAYELLQSKCKALQTAKAAADKERECAAQKLDEQCVVMRQQCHDLRADNERLIASVALLNQKLLQQQEKAAKDARDYKDLQEDNARTQKRLEVAQTLSEEAREQQAKHEEQLRDEKDCNKRIQSQLSILQEEVRRLENEAQELDKRNEVLEERQCERQGVEYERATLRERLEVEVQTLSRALESEELTRAECQMRLQLALEEMDAHKQLATGSATVAKHCNAARQHREEALEKVSMISGSDTHKGLSPPRGDNLYGATIARSERAEFEIRREDKRGRQPGSAGKGLGAGGGLRSEESPSTTWHYAWQGMSTSCEREQERDSRASTGAQRGMHRSASPLRVSNASRTTLVSPASAAKATTPARAEGQCQWQQSSATTTATATTPSTANTVRTGSPTGGAGRESAARVVIPITPPLLLGSGGGARLLVGGGVTANSPPRAKTFAVDSQPCEPSPPVLLSQGVGAETWQRRTSMHTQHLSSFAHVATAPGSGGSGICSSDGDTTGSILSETHARPSMLAQGARFDDEEDTIARQQQHVVEMKEREGLEGVGELRWGRGSVDCKAASLCPPPHYTALAHGRWQDVPAAAPYESGALSGIEGDGSDDLVRLSAAWRQVECQRDAQKVHDKAQERVLAALLAVGASSPTLRQARCVMAAEGR